MLITTSSTLARIKNASSLTLSMLSTAQDSNVKITISKIHRNLAYKVEVICPSWIRVLPPTHNSKMWIAQAQAIIWQTKIMGKGIEATAMVTISSRNSNRIREWVEEKRSNISIVIMRVRCSHRIQRCFKGLLSMMTPLPLTTSKCIQQVETLMDRPSWNITATWIQWRP